MKNFPLNKYRFYNAGNKIIAVSSYAHKTIRGVAICHPEDNFDESIGKQLAAARCNEKIAMKRYARAQAKYTEAIKAYNAARAYVDRMEEYKNDSFIAMNEASQEVDKINQDIANRV